MAMDREKEREMELESAMHTNCLLLGLDPSVIGIGVLKGIPRVGLFRHSNPRLGEQLLHYLICSIRGPTQSAKDFENVWPIYDGGHAREFRKIVLGILNELEEQGEIPKCGARVSALANCCGIRFVELLWQLSVDALREVHQRSFIADIGSSPLPTPMTDQASSHASALFPVVKARIALERRKFLIHAQSAVQRRAQWSGLAREMTTEFRNLCAEEAYLQLELDKMQDLGNKIKEEEKLLDDFYLGSSQSSHLVAQATHLWDSILLHASQYEVLASGPIEDLIAHRDHRYRISGSSLLAVMDQSSQVPTSDSFSSPYCENISMFDDENPKDRSLTPISCQKNKGPDLSYSSAKFNHIRSISSQSGDRIVDLAEVFWRWTRALEHIRRQSLNLARANNGEGPDLLMRSSRSSHAKIVSATLADHEQHLINFEVLISHLTDLTSEIQKSVEECTEQVDTVTSTLYPLTRSSAGSVSPMHACSSEVRESEVTDTNPKSSPGKVSAYLPALKVQKLFSLTLVPTAKGDDNYSVQNLKRSMREAALSRQPGKFGSSRGCQSEYGSDNFETPHSGLQFSHLATDHRSIRKHKPLFESHFGSSLMEKNDSDVLDFDEYLQELNQLNEVLEDGCPDFVASTSFKSFNFNEELQDEISPPTLFKDSLVLDDLYEDLLAPLTETETAMMEL